MKPSMTFSKASFLHILGVTGATSATATKGHTFFLANNDGKGCHKITLKKLINKSLGI